ncbi:TPA: hypothetical protein DCQ44_01730 [Candidatus Taylorbacteria bacterium]|nr:hypothetical protein [Candidatus Taylorbacteria bacterium]
MTTVINNPGENGSNSSGGAGVVIGAVLVVLVLAVGIVLSLPYIRSQINKITNKPVNPTINVTLPAPVVPPQPTTTK